MNAAGLLASANVVAVDQTVQALVEIASAAAGVPASGIDARDETTKELLKPSCNGPKRFVAVLDPTVGTDLSDVNDALQKAGYPFKIDEPDMRGAPVTDGGASNLPSHSTWVSGLYYRNPVAVTLTIQQTQDYASWQPIHSTVMQLPQAGPIGFIPMRANALVRTTHDTVFANGSAVDMSSVRPSEVLSAARAPMLILDGVLTSVSRVAQARLNIGNTDVSLEGQQNTLAAAQLKNQIFRECVADAAIRGVSAAPCLVESD